jgi:Tfp pilus assembly protein FimT
MKLRTPQVSALSLRSFSLVELTVVVVVAGLLFALALPRVRGLGRLETSQVMSDFVHAAATARFMAMDNGAPAVMTLDEEERMLSVELDSSRSSPFVLSPSDVAESDPRDTPRPVTLEFPKNIEIRGEEGRDAFRIVFLPNGEATVDGGRLFFSTQDGEYEFRVNALTGHAGWVGSGE